MKTSLQALLYVSSGFALRISALHLPTAKAPVSGLRPALGSQEHIQDDGERPGRSQ